MKTEKVLFIQTAFLGDAILTLPALQKFKEQNPDCVIDILCILDTESIFSSSPVVDDVIVIDKKSKHKSLLATYRFIKSIKQNNYTRVYSFHRSFRTALIVLMLEVKETFGFDNSSLMHVYKNLIEYDSTKHEVQRNLDLIQFDYNDKDWKIKPEVSVGNDVEISISKFIKENNLQNGFIAIAPGTVWNTKKYPIEYFDEMIKSLLENDEKILLIGGENDVNDCSVLSSKYQNKIIDVCGKFNVIESIELLKFAKLLISNDSAPTHMAMCADTVVLTLYCSTVPEFGFYPYNKKSGWLSFSELDCKPCGIHGFDECPIKTFDCGKKLLPQMVIQKIKEMLVD